MRLILVSAFLMLAFVTAARAQPAPRFEIGPVVRLDSVSVEGGAHGRTPVAGIAAGVRLSNTYGVEAELTQAWNPIERRYEGWFISYAEGPNATREEVERLAPILRRSLGYTPHVGGAAAIVVRLGPAKRVGLSLRAGLSARRYVETSAYEVVSIPDGVDRARFANDLARNFQPSSQTRTRGGLLLGLGLTLAMTDRVTLAPEVRVVLGGPARIGYSHRELGIGARGAWRF